MWQQARAAGDTCVLVRAGQGRRNSTSLCLFTYHLATVREGPACPCHTQPGLTRSGGGRASQEIPHRRWGWDVQECSQAGGSQVTGEGKSGLCVGRGSMAVLQRIKAALLKTLDSHTRAQHSH